MEKTNDLHPAYIAGVIDSDGSLSLINGSTKSKHFRDILQISWKQKKDGNAESVFIKLKEKYGGWTGVYEKQLNEFSNGKKSIICKYSLEGQGLIKLIEDIYPFLQLKKKQAKIIIQHLELLSKHRVNGYSKYGVKGKPQSLWNQEKKIFNKMIKLNNKNSHIQKRNM